MHPIGQTINKNTKLQNMIEYTSERRCFLMASKGQKFNKYFGDLKEEILSKYNFGTPGPQLAKEYGISRFTIASWVRKQNHPELFVDKGNKRGRPKEKDLTKEDWKQRYEILKKYQAFLKAQREKK